MTLEEAGRIRNTEIAKELCLPPVKCMFALFYYDDGGFSISRLGISFKKLDLPHEPISMEEEEEQRIGKNPTLSSPRHKQPLTMKKKI